VAKVPDIDFKLVPEKQVEAAILNPYDRIGWPNRTKEHINVANRQVREIVSGGINQGKGYPVVAKEMKERMDITAGKAQTIAQTEGHRAREMGKLAATEEAADKGVIMRRRWVATLDQNTRDTHGDMDGQEIEMYDEDGNLNVFRSPEGGEAEHPGGFGVAAEDINCRCTTIDVIEGYEPTVRRTREDDIINYGTYNQYAEAKGWPLKYKGAEPRVPGTPQVKYDMVNNERAGNPGKGDYDPINKHTNYMEREIEKRYGMTPEEYKEAVAKRMKELNDKAEITIRVPGDKVNDILKDGRFKSQFETGSSKGIFDPEWRSRGEKTLFKAPESLNPTDRPIYGMLRDATTTNHGQAYGDTVVQLKKSSVINRTTFTYHDSLTLESAPQMLNKTSSNYFTAYPGGKKTDVLAIVNRAEGLKDVAYMYPEAQIHGGVTTDIIEKIIFKKKPTKATIELMTQKGIKYEIMP